MSRTLRFWLATVLPCLLFFAASAEAATISIAWDRNTESNLAGYIVSYGTAAGQYTQVVDVGLSTTWSLNVTDTRTYYFSVQAYNTEGLRSGYSNEASGAAGVTTTAPAPTPAESRPIMAVDLPAQYSTVQPGFVIAGWAADLGSTSGSGVDAIHVWAYPNPGSGTPPVFAGAGVLGFNRPDVAAAFGAAQAALSGFNMTTADLAPGVYDLTIFAHSVVAGAFNNSQVVRVTVAPRASRPMMTLDIPAANATLSGQFQIGGWAVDLAAAASSGVDAVHVWAYPAAGGAPLFVGAVASGSPRPDVGAAFGARFQSAGFNLVGQLPPGTYTLAVFAHSTVVNAFNNTLTAPITVR
jgi:hypothetical protein